MKDSLSKEIITRQTFDYRDVELVAVNLTTISEVGYSPQYEVLLILFKSNKSLYAYYDVPNGVYSNFVAANSLGTYLENNIKGGYSYEKLESASDNFTEVSVDKDRANYIVNIASDKFHKLTCKSAKEMKEENKWYTDKSREELLNAGYLPCGNCKP